MTVRLSTGLDNFLAKDGSLRKAFEDGVLRIYSGAQPAAADDAIGSATLLCEVSKASATFVPGTRSTPKVSSIEITGTPTTGQDVRVTINGTNIDTAQLTADTLDILIARVVATINVAQLDVIAVPILTTDSNFGGSTLQGIILMSLRNGVTFTLAASLVGGSAIAVTVDDAIQANSRGTGLQLGSVSAGVIAKDAETWSGVNAATGTAAWWRFCANPTDAGGASATLVRMDGSVGASSGDLVIPTAFQALATTTLTGANFTVPKNA